MILAILGFIGPFLPDVLGFFKQGQDHRHEMAMMALRHKQAGEESDWRLEEIHTHADIAEMKEIRKPHKSYGIQLLDKGAEAEGLVWRWSFNLIFIAFAFLDWMISSVRPIVTYWIFSLYAIVKTANVGAIYAASERALGNVDGWREALDRLVIVLNNEAVMTRFDQEILQLVLGFWFGQRTRARWKKGE